jgi:predicted Ser/Thr protein kinase
MGVVYQAYDSALNRDVAVKCLREEYRDRTAMAKRFIDEAQITGRLQHPGIPPVYDLGVLPDGRLFLAMKFIAGRNLAELLATQPPAAVKFRIFEQICQTVAFAHAAGFIHRDLKPSNIMVGEYGEVQVMDWGLAKEVRNAEFGVRNQKRNAERRNVSPTDSAGSTPQSDLTRTGSVLGTPSYMAPEQARGDVAWHDPRTDVFALGALLCELLTGQPPFSGTASEVWEQARAGQLEPAYQRLDGCKGPRGVCELAGRCLSNDPGQRPADAGEVVAVLGALTTAAAGRKFRRRAIVALVALLFTMAGAVWAWQYSRSQHALELQEATDIRTAVEQQRDAAARAAFVAAARRGNWAEARRWLPEQADVGEKLDAYREAALAWTVNGPPPERFTFAAGASAILPILRDDLHGPAQADALEYWAIGETVEWRNRSVAFETLATYRGRPRLLEFGDERNFANAEALKKALATLPIRDLSPAGCAALARIMHQFKIDGVEFLRQKCREHPTDYFLHRQLGTLSPADAERCKLICTGLR